ncbi:MAG: hypothetical protein ACXVB0_10910 [Mucilaginibacter sp.]
MSYKFFYLYLGGGTIALILLIIQLVIYYPALKTLDVALNVIPVVLLYYMAYKVRREKEDRDLM